MAYNIVSSNCNVNLTMSTKLGPSRHMKNPHYVAIAKDQSFSHCDIARDIDSPPFDGPEGTPNMLVYQPIET